MVLGGPVANFSFDAAEGVIFIVSGDCSITVSEVGNVAVGIVAEEVCCGGISSVSDGEQAADAAGALEGAAQIQTPDVS